MLKNIVLIVHKSICLSNTELMLLSNHNVTNCVVFKILIYTNFTYCIKFMNSLLNLSFNQKRYPNISKDYARFSV